MHLNYHEVFINEISLLLTLEIDIIKSEKASETKNIHGNVTQIHRASIQIGMANNFMDQTRGNRLLMVDSSSTKNSILCRPNNLNNTTVGWRGTPAILWIHGPILCRKGRNQSRWATGTAQWDAVSEELPEKGQRENYFCKQGWTLNFDSTCHSGERPSKCTRPDQFSLAQTFIPLPPPLCHGQLSGLFRTFSRQRL